MRFTIAGAAIRIAFDGEIGRADLEFSFDGDAEVTMDSLREVIHWAGTPMAEGTTLGAAAISGHVSWSWPVLAFTNAEMRLDGNEANGALSFDFSGDRYGIDGTFAAGQLDISPYTNSFRADLPAGGAWAEAEIALPVLDTLNADIRVSADRLQIGTAHLEAFAGSLIVSDGQLSLNLGQSDFYGGTIDVNVSGDYQAPHLAVAAHVAVDNVAGRPALADIFGITALDGIASGTLDVAGAGDTWGEIIDSLEGGVEAEIVNGVIRGLDLDRVAAMAEPTVEAIGVNDAETAFSRIDATLAFADGRLIADAIEAEGEAFATAFTGWGSLTSSDVGGEGTVYLGSADERRQLPFQLIGTWLEPRFVDVVQP
jgi:AsmA protein